VRVPFERPQPDANAFRDVVRGAAPKRAHFAELFLDDVIVKSILEQYLDGVWVEPVLTEPESIRRFLDNLIHVWFRLGYDYLWTGGFAGEIFRGYYRVGEDTAAMSRGSRIWMEEDRGMVASWDDFEEYPWPDPDSVPLWAYEYVSHHLPDGMGFLMCSGMGVLETVLNIIVGYVPLSFMLHDDPPLARAIFDRVGQTIYAIHERVIGMTGMIGFFPGDDMGFNTGTLISPEHLREYVLPWHKKLAGLAHDNGLVYILHSCGNLDDIYVDLIDDVGIDAKHAFEDKILPVTDFKHRFGSRIGALGGVDVGKLCTYSKEELRPYVESIVDECMAGGGYALGTGNSVANYIPIENYMTMLEVGAAWSP